VEQLAQALPPAPVPTQRIPRLARLRAEALAALGREAEAGALLEATRPAARAQGAPLAEAGVEAGLSRVYTRLGRASEAAEARARAEAIFAALAAGLEQPDRRARFVRRTAGWLPGAR
jgi:hypothetical protein